MRTPYETAVLLAVILNRSGQNRARVSAKTIKLLAGRQHLRSALVVEVITELAEFGWILFEIASGGYGAVQAKTLEAAKAVTSKRFISDEERKALKRGDDKIWKAFENEAMPQDEDLSDDE